MVSGGGILPWLLMIMYLHWPLTIWFLLVLAGLVVPDSSSSVGLLVELMVLDGSSLLGFQLDLIVPGCKKTRGMQAELAVSDGSSPLSMQK